MTVPATQAQIEALELIDTFAWSCVKTDCEESRIELQRRINECRAALTAAPKADVRFREFGGGATWVDFPMTQDSAQTGPTQAQIEAAAKIIQQNVNNVPLDYAEIVARRALTAAAEAGEQEICPHCGKAIKS